MNWIIPEDKLPNTEKMCVLCLSNYQCFVTGYFSYSSGWHDYDNRRIGSVKYWIYQDELLDNLPEEK